MIDVIIPIFDGWKHADLCIRSVERFTHNKHHIILVNNGSRLPETRAMLDECKLRGHTVVEFATNECFSKAINAGLAVSKAPFIAIMNDDVYVNDGWDMLMVSELNDRSVGMVGARSNVAAGLQGNMGLSDVLEPPYLVFVHVMMRRDVYEKVGPLDAETFTGFGSEDLDYSWRIKKEGWRLKVSRAYTLHIGGMTMRRDGNGEGGRQAEYKRMHLKLIAKWGREHVGVNVRHIPRVAIATPSYTNQVAGGFFESMMMLQKTGAFEIEFFYSKRQMIHLAREQICEEAIKTETIDYLLFIDDDMTFPPDTLSRLLSHHKPIVCALAYQRRPRHMACIFEWRETADPDGTFDHMERAENTGLRKIDGCGMACTLIEVKALKKIKLPRFAWAKFGEDLHFCNEARKAGVPIYCDTDLIIGHIGDPVIVDANYVARYRAQQAQAAQYGALVPTL